MQKSAVNPDARFGGVRHSGAVHHVFLLINHMKNYVNSGFFGIGTMLAFARFCQSRG
jgi:hypothetical protein